MSPEPLVDSLRDLLPKLPEFGVRLSAAIEVVAFFAMTVSSLISAFPKLWDGLWKRFGHLAFSSLGLGAAVVAVQPGQDSHFTIEKLVNEPQPKPRFEKARQQVMKRLDEVRDKYEKVRIAAMTFAVIAGLLTFAQVVVGGVLASEFFQETTSHQITGLLGLLVLAASLLLKTYHPELKAETAKEQRDQLDALIRESDDRMVVIETTASDKDDPTLMLGLLEKITAEFNAIMAPPKRKGKADISKSS